MTPDAPDDRVNILLVDDQPAKLLAYEAILSELGENLIKASSGREALEHLLKTEITIVLMDVSMPELDGFELAEIIRQHPRYQKMAIIFVSAVHLTDLDRLKGYESGAVDYVSVPVVPELLRAKIRVFAELYRKTRESERLTRELEQRVSERTAELQASIARQIDLTDRLRAADRRKDEFLALLAHELRNPLAPVLNAASILRLKSYQDPELLWCRDIIERQAKQLTRLVEDLLDVSRISRGMIRLRSETVDLAEIVNAAVETSLPLIESKRHHLSIVVPDQPVILDGDQARLTQVVANLLNNAAKYQDEGGRIEVRVRREGEQGIISVRDEGVGIPPAMLHEVFELFTQAERSPDRSEGGLGIGLSLVRKLAELHGGTVHVASDGPGRGSVFTIRLPAPERAGRRELPRRPDPAFALKGQAPRRILVVDDNRDAAESLARVLGLAGHEVVVAHDGHQALEMAEREKPRTVLLDIGLPGMDGYEVCRRLRARDANGLQIIALTGYGQEKDRQEAKAAGFDSYAVKPVELTELARLLAEK